MDKDAFSQFVFHDAVARGGLKPRDARAKAGFYTAWINQAIARLECAGSQAEHRAALLEIKQDIRNLQSRHGWDGQLMSAFEARQDTMQAMTSSAGSEQRLASSQSRA
jgi:hypothetical protein